MSWLFVTDSLRLLQDADTQQVPYEGDSSQSETYYLVDGEQDGNMHVVGLMQNFRLDTTGFQSIGNLLTRPSTSFLDASWNSWCVADLDRTQFKGVYYFATSCILSAPQAAVSLQLMSKFAISVTVVPLHGCHVPLMGACYTAFAVVAVAYVPDCDCRVDQRLEMLDILQSMLNPVPRCAHMRGEDDSNVVSYLASSRFGPAMLTTYAQQVRAGSTEML